MFRKKRKEAQTSLWVPANVIPEASPNGFYTRLAKALDVAQFGDRVRALCAPYYSDSGNGRPGIDPEVYFKMIMVGHFEGIGSERGIAHRCSDSIEIRHLLKYELHERTPDHSSLWVIRQRLGMEVFEGVFALILGILRDHKLIRGKKLGMDASVMEANAALRSLEHRLTGEDYRTYVKGLAAEAGVDPSDEAAVNRFDRKREGRKTSNDTWQNPHDPDAKVGKTKHGATRMIYKPEHVVDLETGAILDADIRPGDEHDTKELAERVLAVEERINRALGDSGETERMDALVADKGYFKPEELWVLQQVGIETVISDRTPNRNVSRLAKEEAEAVKAAQASSTSPDGRALMRKRGELVERGFQHLLDCGGCRRMTLRGRENNRKTYLIRAACCNLSLLMRQTYGVGTMKQMVAASQRLLQAGFDAIQRLLKLLLGKNPDFALHFGPWTLAA
jgi:transposase